MRDILTCAEWGARPAETALLGKRKAVGITIHHTATANFLPYKAPKRERERCCKLAQQIQNDHFSRDWVDSGHHFLVTRSGLILEGRHGALAAAKAGKVIRGAHAGNDQGNWTYYGIENEGNTDSERMTAEQFAALAELCAWLAFVGGFDTANIVPHDHFHATRCPGRHLRDALPTLRELAHEGKLALMEG